MWGIGGGGGKGKKKNIHSSLFWETSGFLQVLQGVGGRLKAVRNHIRELSLNWSWIRPQTIINRWKIAGLLLPHNREKFFLPSWKIWFEGLAVSYYENLVTPAAPRRQRLPLTSVRRSSSSDQLGHSFHIFQPIRGQVPWRQKVSIRRQNCPNKGPIRSSFSFTRGRVYHPSSRYICWPMTNSSWAFIKYTVTNQRPCLSFVISRASQDADQLERCFRRPYSQSDTASLYFSIRTQFQLIQTANCKVTSLIRIILWTFCKELRFFLSFIP